MLKPITPHMAEEAWRLTQKTQTLLCDQAWPKYNKDLVKESEVLIPIQINGKKRSEIIVTVGLGASEIEKLVLQQPKVQAIIKDSQIKKVIVVPGRIINIVV